MKGSEKELNQNAELFSDEVLGALTSIQDLLILAERYQNHPETSVCLALVSTCVIKLQMNIQSKIIESNESILESISQ